MKKCSSGATARLVAGAWALSPLFLAALAALTAALTGACSSERARSSPAAVGDSGSSAAKVPHADLGPETDCAGCHPDHVDEWRISSHAYGMKDPVFHAMLRIGQEETKGNLGNFCVKCHSPLGDTTGQTIIEKDAVTGVFSQRADGLDSAAMNGVSCLVCHSITNVRNVFNASFDMTPGPVRRGPIRNPDPSTAHESEYSVLYEKTPICGTCHVVVNQQNVALEKTHIEWVQSGFNGRKSCQDCHMPSRVGPAARGHGDRVVHDHRFVGVDVSLLPESDFPGYDDLRARADALLKSTVTFTAKQLPGAPRLDIDIENLAGHAIPSGAIADREMWVEVLVQDAAGKTIYESGTLDDAGNLRVEDADLTTRPGTDPALALYTQRMLFDPNLAAPTRAPAPTMAPTPVGDAGAPTRVDFLWQPNAESSRFIDAEEIAHLHYDLGALPSGTYTANARLLFRTFPPHLLRKLEAKGGLDPNVSARVPTMEMASQRVDITLP